MEVALSPLAQETSWWIECITLNFLGGCSGGETVWTQKSSWQSVPLLLSAVDAARGGGAGARVSLTGSPPSPLQAVPSCQAALLHWDFLHVRCAVLRARRDHHPSPRRPGVGALGLGGQPAPQGGSGQRDL